MRVAVWCLALSLVASCSHAARMIIYPGASGGRTIIKAFDERAARLAALAAANQSEAAQAAAAAHAAAKEQPLVEGDWTKSRSIDVRLDFSAADPHYTRSLPLQKKILGKTVELEYHMGYAYSNLAMLRFGMRFVMAVRKNAWSSVRRWEYMQYYPKLEDNPDDKVLFWQNAVALCTMDSKTLQPLNCTDYDPRTWQECWWGGGFEGQGIEDPRLIVWPGKGLYMMFGSKPWSHNPFSGSFSGMLCDGPWAFQQWLVLVEPYTPQPDPTDSWMQGVIRLRYEDADNRAVHDELRREKNWNPFIYKGELLFSQSFNPHVVIKPSADGTCVKLHETNSSTFGNAEVRGNTQALFIPAAFSGEPLDYYLGIVHVEHHRVYKHMFYKMQSRPPFQIYATSQPIPLRASEHPWNREWTDMAFAMSLELVPETYQVLIGYGSGDQVPRIKVMTWDDVKALFPLQPQQELRNLLPQ